MKITSADSHRVFYLTDDLRKAFEKILSEYHEDVPYIDAFMAVHNFHKLVILDIAEKEKFTDTKLAMFKKMAVDTFAIELQRNRHAIVWPLAMIMIATVFDAARDATIGELPWLASHAIKWIAFYTPLVYIVWRERWKPITVVAVASIGFLLWELTSKLLGRPW